MARIFILDDVDARHQVLARRYPDDERVHAYTYAEGVAALASGRFDLMLLDHDLGEEHNGLHVAEQIAELRPDWLPSDVVVHSHNPSGAERMRDVLERVGIPTRLEPFSSSGFRGPPAPPRTPVTLQKRMEAFLEACRELPEKLRIESVIANLRVAGATKIETIAVLHLLRGLAILEARTTVDASDTWFDRRDTSDEASTLESVNALLELLRPTQD